LSLAGSYTFLAGDENANDESKIEEKCTKSAPHYSDTQRNKAQNMFYFVPIIVFF